VNPGKPLSLGGVGASSVRLPPGAWPTLLDFLVARFPEVGRATWGVRMDEGKVLDATGTPLGREAPYVGETLVHYYREIVDEPRIPFDEAVLHRDEHLLVADKPHFLPVIPSGRFVRETLLVRLRQRYALEALVPVHRIDRGTAGVVIFSCNAASRDAYQALFRRREIHKSYEALAPLSATLTLPRVHRSRLVAGEPFFRMREVPGPANSETHIELAQRRGAHALYRLQPVTGRKHQLRVHMAALGCPIVNDDFYPQLRPELSEDYSRPLKLLAQSLRFRDPLSGQERYFESRRTL
jgi:tRNA pseudouridine32 synthase/23S rRNA pseudouridine746 synthase